MTWAKIDDSFPDHPKIVAAGPICALLQIRAICYSCRFLTDGLIPHGAVSGLVNGLEPDDACKHASGIDLASLMVRNGLWDVAANGYQVHDFLDFNPSKKEVERQRKHWQERAQKGAKARWNKNRTPHASKHAPSSVNPHAPVPVPVPVPLPVLSKEGKKHMTAAPSRVPDPGIRLVLDAYSVAYVTRYREKPVLGVKEASLAGKLLSVYGRDKVLERVAAFFGSGDPFYVKTAHNFGVFYQAFNRLGQTAGEFGQQDMTGLRAFIEGGDDEK